jgi:hypothetical protein
LAVWTVAGFTDEDAQSAFTSAESDTDATVEVVFPAGTHTWNEPVTFTAPDADTVIIRGAGIASTTIVDNYVETFDTLLSIATNSGKFRLYGFKLVPHSNWVGTDFRNSWITISGVTDNFRIHHVHVDPFSVPLNVNHTFRLFGWLRGVIDHCTFDFHTRGGCVLPEYGSADAGGEGDGPWSSPTDYGGSSQIVIEDCTITTNTDQPNAGAAVEDCQRGAAFTSRFNTLNSVGHQTHPTGADGNRMRGCRHLEIYCNEIDDSHTNIQFNFHFHSSGTLIAWNNPISAGYSNVFTFHSMRRKGQNAGGTYSQVLQPDGWGYAGPAPQSGTVTVSTLTTVTKTAGTDFVTTWPANTMIWIAGTAYPIASVDSTTQITLSENATNGAGQAYSVGSNWDGNTDTDTGYPALDQPGRGEGDLLSGAFPNVQNSDNGNAIYSSPDAWPRQAREPMYIWDMAYGGGGNFVGFPAGTGGGVVVENRDYYLEDSSFDGTTGVGVGTRSEMDAITSPTDYVAFWVTDEGSWNAGTNPFYTGQGRLYWAQGGDWVLHYTPLAYPHPLVQADDGLPRKTRKGKVHRGRHGV